MSAASTPLEELTAVSTELRRRGRLSESARARYLERFEHFKRWCLVNDQTPLPADEQTILRYLHAHHPGWGHAHAKTARTAIAFVHEEDGHPKPPSGRTSQYLKVLRRNDKPAEPKVDALRTQEALAIAQAVQPTSDPGVLATRVALALLTVRPTADDGHRGRGRFALLRRAVREVVALPASAFDVSSFDVRVERPGAVPLLIDAAQQPEAYAALVACLADLTERGTSPGELQAVAERVVTLLRAAWRRAGLPAEPDVEAISMLTADDQRRLLAHVDDGHADRVRNHAYISTGLFTAMRHVNLSTLDIREVQVLPHGVGVQILVVRSKNDPDGKGVTKLLTHVGASAQTCRHPICPACAIVAQREEVTVCQGRSAGPLFATKYRGGWRAMTRQNGKLVLAAAWSNAGLPPSARVATRSLRAGAATSASEAGWELWEIATDLTDHRDLATCMVYVRRYDPFSQQYQLKM